LSSFVSFASSIFDSRESSASEAEGLVSKLIGFLSVGCNRIRDDQVGPGSTILVRATANGVPERHVVLSYSREGKFKEYFDASLDKCFDGGLAISRVHQSSLMRDEVSTLKDKKLSNLALHCITVQPDIFFNLLVKIITATNGIINDFAANKQRIFAISFLKATAADVLAAFISQYKTGNSIAPSPELDEHFLQGIHKYHILLYCDEIFL